MKKSAAFLSAPCAISHCKHLAYACDLACMALQWPISYMPNFACTSAPVKTCEQQFVTSNTMVTTKRASRAMLGAKFLIRGW